MSRQTDQIDAVDASSWLWYAPIDDTVVPGRYLPQAATADGDGVQVFGALVSIFSLLALVSLALLVMTP